MKENCSSNWWKDNIEVVIYMRLECGVGTSGLGKGVMHGFCEETNEPHVLSRVCQVQ
jgi:hypothetical protein